MGTPCLRYITFPGGIVYLPGTGPECQRLTAWIGPPQGCDMPDENECKYRPCDVFGYCTNTLGSFFCRSVKWICLVLSLVLRP